MDASVINSGVTATASGQTRAARQGAAGELRENFMTMLVTQLRNQDPLNPLENNELTSQLAQISTVSGVDALNDTLDGINSQIEAGRSLQAAALIGRGVLIPGDHVMVGDEGVSTPFGVELDSPAQTLTARVIGGDGQVIHSQRLEAVQAGVHTFFWDGELADGETAEPGVYRVEFEAEGIDGEQLEALALAYGIVSGVNVADGNARLDLGGVADPVTLEDVRQIL